MERKQKKQHSDKRPGSERQLNSLSSGGNDMKPVIYMGVAWWQEDQMTNYTPL